MLTIRDAQMAALSNHLIDGFVDEILGRARRDMAGTIQRNGDEHSRRIVKLAVEAASASGILGHDGAERLACIALKLGVEPPAWSGSAAGILDDFTMPGERKLEALEALVGSARNRTSS